LIGRDPIPLLEISKNLIKSRAENHLIFKRALNHDSKIVLCAPAGGDVKKGLAFPL
jgi:hypothetical protein